MNMPLMTSGVGQSLGGTQHLGIALMPISLSPLPHKWAESWLSTLSAS